MKKKFKDFDLSKMAVCFIDVQNDFIDGVLGSPQAQNALKNIEKIAELPFGKMFCTLDTHFNDYMDSLEGQHLPVPHCIDGSNGWRIPDNLEEIFRDHGVIAYKKCTFGSTDLAKHLKYAYFEDSIEAVVFVGFCTDICVITNVLMAKAELIDVPIYVVEDACAGVNEEKHQAALEVMKSCHIEIVKTKDFFKS